MKCVSEYWKMMWHLMSVQWVSPLKRKLCCFCMSTECLLSAIIFINKYCIFLKSRTGVLNCLVHISIFPPWTPRPAGPPDASPDQSFQKDAWKAWLLCIFSEFCPAIVFDQEIPVFLESCDLSWSAATFLLDWIGLDWTTTLGKPV